jgi:phosphatidylserine/phosphatidylglycerophosphate/cardiolipin synthase-like enzyme
LGNYPELANFEWGDQIWSALEDLREAGVEEMVNPDIGWQLEVANFSGTYPHSHSKFLVLDGKTLLGAGFNYGYLHFTKDHPSGKGDDLVDLGLQVEGPVAQQALLAYDDLWTGANGVHCEDFYPEDPDQWKSTCSEWKGTTEHIPEVLKYYLPGGDDNAFSLYRSGVYLEADESIKAAISSAEDSLDIVHVNFSLELICAAAVLDENICSYNDALPYMEAIMTAVEQNQTRVRVMAEQSNMNGLENRVAMQVFAEELEKRGLSDYVELRFFNGRLHAKSVLIDDELVIIGSHNFHYSSWGEGGLTEYSLATDSPAAVEAYKDLFEYQWERALSSGTAWKSSSK